MTALTSCAASDSTGRARPVGLLWTGCRCESQCSPGSTGTRIRAPFRPVVSEPMLRSPSHVVRTPSVVRTTLGRTEAVSPGFAGFGRGSARHTYRLVSYVRPPWTLLSWRGRTVCSNAPRSAASQQEGIDALARRTPRSLCVYAQNSRSEWAARLQPHRPLRPRPQVAPDRTGPVSSTPIKGSKTMNNFTAPSVPTRTDGSHRPWTAHLSGEPTWCRRRPDGGVGATSGRGL